jgi:hypothetical protein
VRLPPAWRLLASKTERGGAMEFEALDTGALVYREAVEVEMLAA